MALKPQRTSSKRLDFERAHPKRRGKQPAQKRGRKRPFPSQGKSSDSGTFFCWLHGRFTIADDSILFHVEDAEHPIAIEVKGRLKKWLREAGYNLLQEPVWVSGWPSVQEGKLVSLKVKSCFDPSKKGITETWYFWGNVDGDVMEVRSARLKTVYRHSIPGLARIVDKPGCYQLELTRHGLDIIPLSASSQQQPVPPPPGVGRTPTAAASSRH